MGVLADDFASSAAIKCQVYMTPDMLPRSLLLILEKVCEKARLLFSLKSTTKAFVSQYKSIPQRLSEDSICILSSDTHDEENERKKTKKGKKKRKKKERKRARPAHLDECSSARIALLLLRPSRLISRALLAPLILLTNL